MDTQITEPHETRVVKSDVITGVPEETPVESLKDKAGQVASRVGEEIREETSKRAKGFLRGQKNHLADELHKTAEVFRESSRQFQDREQGTAARYVNEIASQADRFSRYLGERDLDQLASEIKIAANKSPMLFLLSAFASGFIMSRFLRSPNATTPASPYGKIH